MPKILIIEDDENVLEALDLYLNKIGFETVLFDDSTSALTYLYKNEVNIVLLDMNLPEISGIDSINSIKNYSDAPIICISAIKDTDFIVKSLMLGSDDYLTKPLDLKILVAKINVLLRKNSLTTLNSKNDEKLYFINNDFYLGTERINLTSKELQILNYLYTKKNSLVKKEELEELLNIKSQNSRVVDNHIKNIRIKINDNSKDPKYIKSIYSQGILLNII